MADEILNILNVPKEKEKLMDARHTFARRLNTYIMEYVMNYELNSNLFPESGEYKLSFLVSLDKEKPYVRTEDAEVCRCIGSIPYE